MRVLAPEAQALHAPPQEFYRGQLVPAHEGPGRWDAVLAGLRAAGHRIQSDMPHDSRPWLAQVHTPRYLAFLENAWRDWCALDPAHAQRQPWPSTWPVRGLRADREPQEFSARLGLYSFDSGTPLSAGTWAAAKASCDAAVSAAHLLMQGAERAVFCATRPPGHHALADAMGGYCFLNQAAVGAQALRGLGAARVAILDVDYHHGNGTQSIFYARDDVLVVSLHGDPRTEYPFFLGHADEAGEGAGQGFNLNLPLPAGTEATAWFAALRVGLDRLRMFAPDALVVSLGLDTYEHDPISRFKLSTADFHRLGHQLAVLQLPTLIVLEGGYAVQALGANTAAVLAGFEG